MKTRTVPPQPETADSQGLKITFSDNLAARSLFGERNQHILKTAHADGNDVAVHVEQEPGSSGLDSVNEIIRLLVGFNIRADKVTGSKGVRAEPFAAQAEAGNVKMKRASWNGAYIDELTTFPNGLHDDQVDGSSGAFMQLASSFWMRYDDDD